MLRRVALLGGIFILLGIIWYWPVLKALIWPTLESAKIVEVAEVPGDSFIYPNLGISAPLTTNPSSSPLRSSDWAEIRQALREGVSLAYEDDSFTTTDLAFVTGHSSDVEPHAYSAVFAGLGQAKLGEEFKISIDKRDFVYLVIDTLVLDPANLDGFRDLAPNDSTTQRIAVVTCWPPLTTNQRLVVIGERKI